MARLKIKKDRAPPALGDKKEYDHSAPIPVDDTHLVDEEFEDDFDDDFDDEDFSDLDDSYNT